MILIYNDNTQNMNTDIKLQTYNVYTITIYKVHYKCMNGVYVVLCSVTNLLNNTYKYTQYKKIIKKVYANFQQQKN